MNYDKIYDLLMSMAKMREIYYPISGYIENHHILPECLYPEFKDLRKYPENSAILTPEEHYLAHQLLIKMSRYKNHVLHFKLVLGAKMMCVANKIIKGAIRNNKEFGWIRRRAAESQSIRMSGENNSNFGGLSVTHRENLSIARKEGFANGSIVSWNIGIPCRDESKDKMSISNSGKPSAIKGKTFEEFYGEELASLRKANISKVRLDKTWEEIFGVEKATKMKKNHIEKRKGKPTWNKGKTNCFKVKPEATARRVANYKRTCLKKKFHENIIKICNKKS